MTPPHPQSTWLASDVYELPLPADRTAAKTGRSYATQTWPELDGDTLDDLWLLVSELITNAQRHGQPRFCLRIRVDPDLICVAVLDHGSGIPSRRDPARTESSGRGMRIVEAVAESWGVETLDNHVGKYVWASMRRPPALYAPW